MTTTQRSNASSVALAEGYYYENGCTVASKVHLTERNYGTRRTFFFRCDPAAVQAILPDGWILRPTAEPEFHLMVHFNDWLHTSHADNTPHTVQAPPYVGFLVPVQNSILKRSGIMQVYGLAAGSHYTGGPYKAYRAGAFVWIVQCEGFQLNVDVAGPEGRDGIRQARRDELQPGLHARSV
jgi:hypothetical protein